MKTYLIWDEKLGYSFIKTVLWLAIFIPFIGINGSEPLPYLIVPDKGKEPTLGVLEPSGLVWDEEFNLAVGISDDRLETPGYEIFAFDPYEVVNNTIKVIPLMSRDASGTFQLNDLECLTRTKDGEYFAICSLSLDKEEDGLEDRWSRFQGVRFWLEKIDSALKIVKLQRISEHRRPNLREWMISSSGRSWPNEAYRKRSSKGGIDIEALASTKDGVLVLGFRGPLEAGPKAPVLYLQLDGIDSAPKTVKWSSVDVSELPGSIEEKERGLRALERIPGTARYVGIVGHTGTRHDPLRMILWDPTTGKVKDRGALPAAFVGEGIAVIKRTDSILTVLMVDDLKGRVLIREIADLE